MCFTRRQENLASHGHLGYAQAGFTSGVRIVTRLELASSSGLGLFDNGFLLAEFYGQTRANARVCDATPEEGEGIVRAVNETSTILSAIHSRPLLSAWTNRVV